MSEERISINNLINSPLAVSSDKAKIVFEKIEENMHKKQISIIDFSEIKSLTTAFLNVAIGELYKDKDRETLNKFIKIDSSTLTSLQREKVKMVMDNSRNKYYSAELRKKIDEVSLHGETD